MWVDDRKIASIGIHVSRRVSIARLRGQRRQRPRRRSAAVIACGLPDVQMTSLQAEGSPEGIDCFRKRAAFALRAGVRAPPADRHAAAAARARRRHVRWSARRICSASSPRADVARARRTCGARAAEDAGFESLLFAEHTHIPVRRDTPTPRRRRAAGEVLAHARPVRGAGDRRAATERLRLGTGICLVIERDPITTAKEVASLDQLSGGRFEFGVGARLEPRGDAQPRHRPAPRGSRSCASACRR